MKCEMVDLNLLVADLGCEWPIHWQRGLHLILTKNMHII